MTFALHALLDRNILHLQNATNRARNATRFRLLSGNV